MHPNELHPLCPECGEKHSPFRPCPVVERVGGPFVTVILPLFILFIVLMFAVAGALWNQFGPMIRNYFGI